MPRQRPRPHNLQDKAKTK